MVKAHKKLRKIGLISTQIFLYISLYWLIIEFGVLFGIMVTPGSNRDFSGLWITLFPFFWVIVSSKILGKDKWKYLLGNSLLIFSALFFIPIVIILFIPSAYFLLPTLLPTFFLSLSSALFLRNSHAKKFGKNPILKPKAKSKRKEINLVDDADINNLYDQITRGLKFYMVKSALHKYVRNIHLIVSLKGNYAKKLLSPYSKRIFNFSLIILFYGILLSFFVIIPVINHHYLIVNKWLYLLFNLQYAFVAGIILHFSFRALGGKGTLKETIAYMNILSGSLLPIQTFLLLPNSLIVKFDPLLFVKGPFYNFFETFPEWTSISILILLVLFYVITYYAISLFIAWISYLHGIDRAKVFVVWILASPLFLIYLIFLYPIIGDLLYRISFKFLNMV
jgi:hypothetical protein